jgi:hypothetical protein
MSEHTEITSEYEAPRIAERTVIDAPLVAVAPSGAPK